MVGVCSCSLGTSSCPDSSGVLKVSSEGSSDSRLRVSGSCSSVDSSGDKVVALNVGVVFR